MRNKSIWLVVLLVVLVAVGYWYWSGMQSPTEGGMTKAGGKGALGTDKPPVNVEVIQARTENIPVQIRASGHVIASNKGSVNGEVSGKIVAINFKDGDLVKKGQILYQIDDRQAKADVAAAKADLELANQRYDRAQQVESKGLFSKQDLDDLKNDIETKRNALERATITFDNMSIEAPYDGHLGQNLKSVGDYLSPGMELVTITDNNSLKADYQVSDQYLSQVKLGQALTIQSDTLPGQTFKGKVNYIAPTVDAATRTVMLSAAITNNNEALLDGMSVEITQLLQSDRAVLVVPEHAVFVKEGKQKVFVVEERKAKERNILTGANYGGLLEIKSGLENESVVVTEGHQKLSDGASVTIINQD